MTVIGILVAILVLGVLILVHELGHFLLAKATGIAVDEFAIGFGKELIGWDKGGTRYRINLIPLGGYCKMRGEESADRKSKDDKLKEAIADEPVKEKEKDPHAMYNRPAWARVLTILGGPVFNYIFAIILFSVLFMAGLKENYEDFSINVVSTNYDGTPTPAVLAGLKDGDKLLNINGKDVVNYSVVMEQFGLNANVPLSVTYERQGVTNETTITPIKHPERGLGFGGVYQQYSSLVGHVDKKSPAELAGMKSGDKIVRVEYKKVSGFSDLAMALSNKIDKEVLISVERQDQLIDLKVTPIEKDGGIYLGISPTMVKKRKAKNFFNAFAMGFKETNITLKEKIWFGLKKMFSGNLDVQKNISGPIRIVQITSKVAMYSDFNRLIQFMALISVALGFFNLLPIPGLDGAHFLINLFEMVTTIKPNEKVMMVIEYVGFFIVIGLSILVVGNDLFNIIRDFIQR